jgi:serine/threonine-protein kinase
VIGRVVGKYRILEQIGEGGMGTVYRAEHTVLGSPAAVKVLLPVWTQDAVVVDRFFHEAKAATAIHHVGIVDVFDYGRLSNDQAWIAMELLRGEQLQDFMARHQGKLAPTVAQTIALQILSALDAAHHAGVVHRDLKPDNMFLVRDPGEPGGVRVKILDFGVAKLGADRFGAKMKTEGGTLLGTPSYMSPEQCRGSSEIDARADLYAFGCILFELLTGRPPFITQGALEVMSMHLHEPAPRLTSVAPGLPIELDALIAKLLVKDPSDRVPSAAYALAALERISLPPLVAEIRLVGADGGRPATYILPSERPTDRATDFVPADYGKPPSLHDGGAETRLPRWVPITVVAVAVLIAIIAIIAIGNTGASVSGH